MTNLQALAIPRLEIKARGPGEGAGILRPSSFQGGAEMIPGGVTPLRSSRDPAMVYLARLTPGSRRTMVGALRTIIEIGGSDVPLGGFPWWQLGYQHAQAIRTALAARYAPATANKILAALKGVLKETWRLGYMDAESFHRAVDLPPVRGTSVPRGRALSRSELDRVLSVCRSDIGPTGCRDLALLSVLYGAGLRRREVTTLQVEDYNAATGCCTVQGKGAKVRTVYIKNGQKQALENWLLARGPKEGPIFLGTGGRGRQLTARGMSVDAIYDVCRSRAAQAGIPAFSPHDLRRTAISDMLDAGADISAVKAVAGHSQIETTARYDRRGERAKEQAASLLAI